MKITIIRHAEPDYENNTLTEKGFKEAEILGKYLKDEKLDYIYVSPFARADYTAKAILKYNKNKLTIQQYRTIKGQIRKGDLNGALTGLKRLGVSV